MSEDHQLSPDGRKQRAKILRLAQREARSRRRRRRGWQLAFGAFGMVAMVALLVSRRGMPITPAPPDVRLMATAVPAPTTRGNLAVLPAKPVQIIIVRVASEPDISRRLAVKMEKPSWEMLSDDQLLQALNSAGHPAGLAWINGHEMVLFRQPPDAQHESVDLRGS